MARATPSPQQYRDSIYEESSEMLLGSLIIYIFAELRQMIREGISTSSESKLTLTLQDLEPPLTAQKALSIIQTHKEALKERAIHHEDLESRLEALKIFYEQQQETNSTLPTKQPIDTCKAFLSQYFSGYKSPATDTSDCTPTSEGAILKQFVDYNAQEELVHAIVVNPYKKRITVIFRGSVTSKDFLQDAKCAQIKVKNPVFSLDQSNAANMPPTIRLHTGFYQYLSHLRTREKTRLDEILYDIQSLLQEYPGYSLFITGHSLGGALSTIFGFYAACNDQISSLLQEKPVVVYSIASPYCGNWKFRHAFQELERRGKLQHLRIANLEDMVTLLPFAVPKATFLSPAVSMVKGGGNLYKHVGIKLQFKTNPEVSGGILHSITYPKEHHCEDDQEFAKEVQDAIDAGRSLVKALYHLCMNNFQTVEKYHSCDEYELRLSSCRSLLENITLEGLYDDSSLVGKLFTDGYSPLLPPKSGIRRTINAFSALRKGKRDSSVDDEDQQLTLGQAAAVEQKM